MAGSASRVYNFCRSNPNSSGCPWPSYSNEPYDDPCSDPYSIGTTNCKKYTVYINAFPALSNPDTLVANRIPIIQVSPSDGSGNYLGYTSVSKLNLYSNNDNGVLSNN
jgi:hypothetical protein